MELKITIEETVFIDDLSELWNTTLADMVDLAYPDSVTVEAL